MAENTGILMGGMGVSGAQQTAATTETGAEFEREFPYDRPFSRNVMSEWVVDANGTKTLYDSKQSFFTVKKDGTEYVVFLKRSDNKTELTGNNVKVYRLVGIKMTREDQHPPGVVETARAYRKIVADKQKFGPVDAVAKPAASATLVTAPATATSAPSAPGTVAATPDEVKVQLAAVMAELGAVRAELAKRDQAVSTKDRAAELKKADDARKPSFGTLLMEIFEAINRWFNPVFNWILAAIRMIRLAWTVIHQWVIADKSFMEAVNSVNWKEELVRLSGEIAGGMGFGWLSTVTYLGSNFYFGNPGQDLNGDGQVDGYEKWRRGKTEIFAGINNMPSPTSKELPNDYKDDSILHVYGYAKKFIEGVKNPDEAKAEAGTVKGDLAVAANPIDETSKAGKRELKDADAEKAALAAIAEQLNQAGAGMVVRTQTIP